MACPAFRLVVSVAVSVGLSLDGCRDACDAVVAVVIWLAGGVPEQSADLLRDVPANLRCEVLVPPGHAGVGPTHDPHYRPLRDAQDQQHRCRRMAGIVQAAVTQAGDLDQPPPLGVVSPWVERLASWRCENPSPFYQSCAARDRTWSCSSRCLRSNVISSSG